MIITIASYKGGVGKTTTAIHLAAYFQRLSPTLLIDGDAIRTSVKWSKRGDGKGLPFTVVDKEEGLLYGRDPQYRHFIVDTEANIESKEFPAVAKGCDFLVIPAVPEAVATDGLSDTLQKLEEIDEKSKLEKQRPVNYRVLITMVNPLRPAEAERLRASLLRAGVPVLKAEIPRLAAFDKAAAAGVPVYAASDEHAARAWAAYEAVGKEISNGRKKD